MICVSGNTIVSEYGGTRRGCSDLVWTDQMLKDHNVKHDVMTLFGEDLNDTRYLIQHG